MPKYNEQNLKKGSESKNKLIIKPQTVDGEFDYLWSLLQKMPFYIKNGYSISLPDNQNFQRLIDNPETLKTVNKDDSRQLFIKKVYDPLFFRLGLDVLNAERHKIEVVFPDFQKFNDQWGFKLFPQYQIHLTRYGPGGSYNSNTGVIIMMAKADGSFKRQNPLHSIIHELIHIGIEDVIVKKYGLTHWEKERVVDKICVLRFGLILPGYELQKKGITAIDTYVNNESINNLPAAIEKYIKDNPRD